MEATLGRPISVDPCWRAAEDLACAVVDGGRLPVLSSPVALDPGETLHAKLQVEGWRFMAVDATYQWIAVLSTVGPLVTGAAMTAAVVANRRAREAAAREAAPQWRPLGLLPTLVTNCRLLVLHEGEWQSVWYDALTELRPDLPRRTLELRFEADPPYLLHGPEVPYLAVALAVASRH